MHRLTYIFVFMVSLFGFVSKIQSEEQCLTVELTEESIFELLNLGDSSILGVEENRVYIAPEKVVVDAEGIFLHPDSGTCFQLPFISANQRGCYTFISGLNAVSATAYPVIKCKKCKIPFSPDFFNKGVCPHCGFKN